MDLKELTNVELLYHEDLKNKVLIQIPNTPYHILCTYIKKSDKWNIHVLELLSSKRKKIADNVIQSVATEIIKRTVDNGKNQALKHSEKIETFANELKQTIYRFSKKQKTNELQRNRINRPRNRP